MKYELWIPAIAGKVHLGCLPEEREQAQPVQVELRVQFKKAPPALKTDDLSKTPCYKDMADLLETVFSRRHYATIEALALEGFQDLKKYLLQFPCCKKSHFHLKVHKLHPPVDSITQGSHFSLSDRL